MNRAANTGRADRVELRAKFARFNLPFLSLPSTTPRETALDVFVKMNTSAQPLSTYDIVVAQVEAGTGISLHDMVDELRLEVPLLEHFAEPAQVILSAGALLQNREPSKSSMLSNNFAEGLIDHWNDLVHGSQRAARFLDEEHVFDKHRSLRAAPPPPRHDRINGNVEDYHDPAEPYLDAARQIAG